MELVWAVVFESVFISSFSTCLIILNFFSSGVSIFSENSRSWGHWLLISISRFGFCSMAFKKRRLARMASSCP